MKEMKIFKNCMIENNKNNNKNNKNNKNRKKWKF